MSIPDSASFEDLVDQGRWEKAIAALTLEIEQDNSDPISHFNRGTCALGAHRLKKALADFRRADELSADNDLYPAFIGIALWWLGEGHDAVKLWEAALTRPYTDEAGGVEIPALLLFASQR